MGRYIVFAGAPTIAELYASLPSTSTTSEALSPASQNGYRMEWRKLGDSLDNPRSSDVLVPVERAERSVSLGAPKGDPVRRNERGKSLVPLLAKGNDGRQDVGDSSKHRRVNESAQVHHKEESRVSNKLPSAFEPLLPPDLSRRSKAKRPRSPSRSTPAVPEERSEKGKNAKQKLAGDSEDGLDRSNSFDYAGEQPPGWLEESWEAANAGDSVAESEGFTARSCMHPAPSQSRACAALETLLESQSAPERASQSLPVGDITTPGSLLQNLPEWYFNARQLTPLSKLSSVHPRTPVSVLVYIVAVQALREVTVRKNGPRGGDVVAVGGFECVDEGGVVVVITLWGDTAKELTGEVRKGDLVFLSGITTSRYDSKLQGNSTSSTRAQIAYRLLIQDAEDIIYCPDLRLAYDATTRKVAALVDWARKTLLS